MLSYVEIPGLVFFSNDLKIGMFRKSWKIQQTWDFQEQEKHHVLQKSNDNTDWIRKKNIWRRRKNGSLWCCQEKRSSVRKVSYWDWRKEYLGFNLVEVKWSRKLWNYLEKTSITFISTWFKAARFQKLLSGVSFPYAGEIADAN